MDKWLANNTAAKIIALAVALILWAMVHVDTDAPTITRSSQGDHTTIANLSIEPYGLDADKYVLKTVSPQQVSVNVSGQSSQLASLATSSEYEVKMDLSKIEEAGQYTVSLQVDTPPGVELLSILPSKVTVTVEEKVTQAFDAVVLTTGVPAEGFTELDPIFEDGNAVQVTLPASEMKQVQKIQGEISVEGSNGNVSGRIKLVAYSNNGEILDDAVIEPASLKVQIPISSNVSSKTLPLNVSYSGSLPDGLVLSDVKAGAQEVTVYGSAGVLESLSSYPPVTLDLDRITAEGATTYSEALAAPEGVDRIVPSSVNYTLTVVPYEQKTIANVPITLTGLAKGNEATITDPESSQMDVTIVGASSLLAGVTASDITLTADLAGLNAGTHNVQLAVELPNYIQTNKANPLSVTVEITGTASDTESQPPAETDTENPAATPGTDGNSGSTNETDPGTEPSDAENNANTDTPSNEDPVTEQPGTTEETPTTTPDEGTTDSGQTDPTENDGTTNNNGETAPEQGNDTGGEAVTP
ncbi:CdaR family protein [Saccharibacillus sacchari]|uniref:CdaR family protein n=1 Tax=Saccharibacillus sacchari TaxID=456493 RepID=A0ACC6PHL5_9BACL